jgi:hypothetical protein
LSGILRAIIWRKKATGQKWAKKYTVLWQLFLLIKLKRHSRFDIPKKKSTPKAKFSILMLPDLQSLKWNGHALLHLKGLRKWTYRKMAKRGLSRANW